MSASKRDELVQNALQVFYSGGFHAVGMDSLAKATGVSKTAIYKHFRTKEDLILATLRLRDEQFRNWLVRRVEALETDPRKRLCSDLRCACGVVSRARISELHVYKGIFGISGSYASDPCDGCGAQTLVAYLLQRTRKKGEGAGSGGFGAPASLVEGRCDSSGSPSRCGRSRTGRPARSREHHQHVVGKMIRCRQTESSSVCKLRKRAS